MEICNYRLVFQVLGHYFAVPCMQTHFSVRINSCPGNNKKPESSKWIPREKYIQSGEVYAHTRTFLYTAVRKEKIIRKNWGHVKQRRHDHGWKRSMNEIILMTALLCVIEWALSDDSLLPSCHANICYIFTLFLLCTYTRAPEALLVRCKICNNNSNHFIEALLEAGWVLANFKKKK